jgi:hypothetical protein
MTITKIDYDKNYPYIVSNAWGEKMCCDEADLIELKKEIDLILEEKENK